MKIEVNDYVRTKWGYICKIININEFREPSMRYSVEASYLKDIMFIGDEEIIKSSPNIIDILEVGDLIRIQYYSLRYEERVTRLFEVTFKDKKYINLNNSKCDFMLIDGDFNKSDKELEPIIKSIVTKEQFESMEYKMNRQIDRIKNEN